MNIFKNAYLVKCKIGQFYKEYIAILDGILEKNYKIIIDTAHVYASGLSTDSICKLFKQFSNNMMFCHFNGNTQSQLRPDIHTPMFKEDNKIQDIEDYPDF